MGDNETDVGSTTAVMVYTTLANTAKADTEFLNLMKSGSNAEKPRVDKVPPAREAFPETIREERNSDVSDNRDSDDDRDRPHPPSRCSSSASSRQSSRASSAHSEDDDSFTERRVFKPLETQSRHAPGVVPAPPASSAVPVDKLPHLQNGASNSTEEMLEKQSLLIDLQRMQVLHGVVLSKQWTVNDRIEDLTFEVQKHTLHQDEKANVNLMKDGLRLMCTGIELLNNRIGLLELDGWSSEACKDLDKHEANLCKLYRKYWRRQSSTPEVDIVTSMLASIGMYHFNKKMNKPSAQPQKRYASKFPRTASRKSVQDKRTEDSSDEEAPP